MACVLCWPLPLSYLQHSPFMLDSQIGEFHPLYPPSCVGTSSWLLSAFREQFASYFSLWYHEVLEQHYTVHFFSQELLCIVSAAYLTPHCLARIFRAIIRPPLLLFPRWMCIPIQLTASFYAGTPHFANPALRFLIAFLSLRTLVLHFEINLTSTIVKKLKSSLLCKFLTQGLRLLKNYMMNVLVSATSQYLRQSSRL